MYRLLRRNVIGEPVLNHCKKNNNIVNTYIN